MNKTSKTLKNIYHVNFIDNLEELAIRSKGCIDMERANTVKEFPVLIREPK